MRQQGLLTLSSPGAISLGVILLTAGAVSAPAEALACGALPTPTYAVTGITPDIEATDVPRDGAVIVTGSASSRLGRPGFPVDVTVFDDVTGESVSGQSIDGSSGELLSAAWYPSAPLLAGRVYRIEAAAVNEGGVAGEPRVANFTTGDALLAPFESLGKLKVSLERYDADVETCEYGLCGQRDCVVTGSRRALRAKVTIPATVGGQVWGTAYIGRLDFTDNSPFQEASGSENHEIYLRQGFAPVPGEAVVLKQEILEEDFDYAPCFTVSISDAAGHHIETSKCLAVMSPEEIRGQADVDPEQADDTGCSISRGATLPSPWLLSALVGVIVGLGLRRFRGKRALS